MSVFTLAAGFLSRLGEGAGKWLPAAAVAALALILVIQEWRIAGLREAGAAQARELGEVTVANHGLAAAMNELKLERDGLEAALKQRDEANHAVREELEAVRRTLAEAGQKDADYRAWRDAPLPAVVLGLLSGQDGHGDAGGNAAPRPAANPAAAGKRAGN